MANSSKTPEQGNRPGWPLMWGAAGIGVLAVLCCAGPVLVASGLAAGGLAAIGAWAANPWIIAAAIILAAVVIAGLLLRHIARRPDRPSGDDCCDTGNADRLSGNRERPPARDRKPHPPDSVDPAQPVEGRADPPSLPKLGE